MNKLVLSLLGGGVAVIFYLLIGKKWARRLAAKWAGCALDRCFREWETPYMSLVVTLAVLSPLYEMVSWITTDETAIGIAMVIVLFAVIGSGFLLLWEILAEFIRRREREKENPSEDNSSPTAKS